MENILIKYEDSGKGLPDKVKIDKVYGYGLRLLNTFTKQLKGEFHFMDTKHFAIEINIPNIFNKN